MDIDTSMGFVAFPRGLTVWEWYDDPNTCRLFIHLLLTTGWKDKQWHGLTIRAGSRVTSRRAPEGSKYKYEGEIVNLSCWHDLADAALCIQKGDMLDVWVHEIKPDKGQNGKTYYYATAEAMVLDLRAVLRVIQTYSNAAPMTPTNIPTPFDASPEADLSAPLDVAGDLPF